MGATLGCAAPASPEHCETSLHLFIASSASPASYASWQHLLREQLISWLQPSSPCPAVGYMGRNRAVEMYCLLTKRKKS